MTLPQIAKNIQKRTRQSLQMLGINLTDNYTIGELDKCNNISTDRYPYITTAQRKKLYYLPISEGYKPISMYAWEKLFVVTDEPANPDVENSGYKCYYGGTYCGNAVNTTLPKQYAVVNSKLIMFPDKVYFNLYDETMTSKPLGTATKLAVITSGTITMRKKVSTE